MYVYIMELILWINQIWFVEALMGEVGLKNTARVFDLTREQSMTDRVLETKVLCNIHEKVLTLAVILLHSQVKLIFTCGIFSTIWHLFMSLHNFITKNWNGTQINDLSQLLPILLLFWSGIIYSNLMCGIYEIIWKF